MVFSSQHMFKFIAYSESNASAQASHASGTCLSWINCLALQFAMWYGLVNIVLCIVFS